MSFTQHDPPTPAMTALLNAFTGWQAFEQTSAPTIPSTSNVTNHADPANFPRPPSAALAFIQSCPYIDLADMSEHERNCPVCYDPYHPLSELGKTPQERKEENIIFVQRMPCGHYMCNRCLYNWLDPLDQSNHNTCPYDRRVLFEPLPGTEGLQQRVNLIDWIYRGRGQHPVGDERDKTSWLKARLVQCRLREAIGESDVDLFLMHSRINKACEIDNAVLCAQNQELVQFEHRLNTIENIATTLEEHMPISTFRVRLQQVVQDFARTKETFRRYGAP